MIKYSIIKYIRVSSLLIFLFTSINIIAQTTISGIIKDKTNETLIGASIVVKGTTIGTTTDVNGAFKLEVPQQPPFTLVANFIGYNSEEIVITENNQKLNIRLSASDFQLDVVEIQDTRLTEKQKEAPLTIETMDISAIKNTPSADFYEALSHLKGVDITSASMGFKVINTRGFNSTSPVRSLQLIDGVDNQSPGLNFSLGNFLGASELDIQRVELIVGASSAYFGPNAFNGVILMTTKDPFIHQGLSVSAKVGERSLVETGVRWADALKNKAGIEKFAYKINLYFMRAYDWEADNMDPTFQSKVGRHNPGGYDAVNRYGDENLSAGINNATSLGQQVQYPGLMRWHRTGYLEKDLVDYNTRNLKANTALHYRLNPETELIYAFNFGTGTTVYQGDNRYSLKNILFYQNRVELRKRDKFFIRAYATHEDAGDSYDAVFTAFKLQGRARSDIEWSTDYRSFWGGNIASRVRKLEGFRPPTIQGYDFEHNNAVMDLYIDSLLYWHQLARIYADSAKGNFLQPGTPEFDAAFNDIISKKLYSENGTKFYDKSALYHVQGEYRFSLPFAEMVTGGNFRLYTPDSDGTIFSDTAGREISNKEVGFFLGAEKRLMDERLKLNLTARADKNENFPLLISPALSAVYTHSTDHIFRLSFSSAIRNPTLADQYLYYNVGRAILVGNISGFDSLLTVESLSAYLNTFPFSTDSLEYFNIDPVRPEKVKSIEIGYRGFIFDKFYIDGSYYFSFYNDFLGYMIGVDANFHETGQPTYVQAYRVAANASELVTTQGASIGINYYFGKYYLFGGNYSWNKLDRRGSDNPIIPAFNTPEHKFNISLSGKDMEGEMLGLRFRNYGFSINYRWVEGFLFEGSPQFTGFVPTYDMLDFQVNKFVPRIKTTFKAGASNLLNKKQMQVYGGPRIGRLAYLSIILDLK